MYITNLDVCAKEPDKPVRRGPLFQVQNQEITNIVKRILELKNMETYFVHNINWSSSVLTLFVRVEGPNIWLPRSLRNVISLAILYIWNECDTQQSSRSAMQFSKVFIN